MQKEAFISKFFRMLAIVGPLLMIVKNMAEKRFSNIWPEITVFLIYIILLAYFWGYLNGMQMREKKDK